MAVGEREKEGLPVMEREGVREMLGEALPLNALEVEGLGLGAPLSVGLTLALTLALRHTVAVRVSVVVAEGVLEKVGAWLEATALWEMALVALMVTLGLELRQRVTVGEAE